MERKDTRPAGCSCPVFLTRAPARPSYELWGVFNLRLSVLPCWFHFRLTPSSFDCVCVLLPPLCISTWFGQQGVYFSYTLVRRVFKAWRRSRFLLWIWGCRPRNWSAQIPSQSIQLLWAPGWCCYAARSLLLPLSLRNLPIYWSFEF